MHARGDFTGASLALNSASSPRQWPPFTNAKSSRPSGPPCKLVNCRRRTSVWRSREPNVAPKTAPPCDPRLRSLSTTT
eukprot:scaffold442_cov268-Pinguiococcus_pyrenoidosus.AAC.67